MKCLLSLAILLSAVANVSAHQADDEKLSPTEEEEVRSFVKQFAATIEKTRDLTPYLNRPPASDLMDQALRDANDPVGLVDYKLGSKVGKHQLRKFNIVLWNLGYLSNLYVYSQFLLEKTAVRDLRPEKQYPPNVVHLMQRNALVKRWWRRQDLSDSETVIRTPAEFRSLLHTFQRAAFIMRRYFNDHPPEKRRTYRQNLTYLAPFLKDIAVDRCSSEKHCAGLPLHTQEIKVNLPVLQLVLVRLNGKLQILIVGIGDD